jgi:Domain of unknown function (DUF397)
MTSPREHPPHPTPDELDRAAWFKASASNGGGQTCVEVAHLESWTVVRDSKDPDGPVHCYTPLEWACFLDGARAGEFDRP